MTIISLILSLLIGVGFIFWQFKVFRENSTKLKTLQTLFPDNIDAYYLKDVKYTEDTKEICVRSSTVSSEFSILIGELNEYSRKNIGATDFAIIQNKTERYVKMQYDNAVSKLAFPTYIGLMGTFLGVALGLFFFSVGSTSLANDENVYQLIYGVLVSMSTSFCGLLLTTKSNSKSSETKRILDLRKNIFYDFIQNDMMPAMGTSMVFALTKLRETLGTFEPAFGRIIGSFRSTFDECTSRFGENFNETVKAVTDAAQTLGSSIAAVNDNVKQQRELLDEIRSGEMMIALNSFLEACDALENSSNTLNSFIESTKAIEESTKSLVATQLKYNAALEIPMTITEKLNAILDRITTFEDNINNLGEVLGQTELVSNKTIASIEQHLQSVKAKNDIAESYIETGNDQLKELFEVHKEAIDSLHHSYVSLLADHQANLENTIEDIGNEMMKSRNLLMEKLATAFDFLKIEGDFAHLSRLPEIKENLDELKNIISSFPPEVSKFMEEHESKENLLIDGLMDNVQDNAKQINKVKDSQNELSESLNRKTSEIIGQISDVKLSVATRNEMMLDKLDSVIDTTSENINKGITSVKDEVNKITEDIAALTSKFIMISSKSDEINDKIKDIDELAKQIDDIKTDVANLLSFNEDNPVEKLELGSLTNLGKMIEAQQKKVEEVTNALEAHANSDEMGRLEGKLQTLSAIVQDVISQLGKKGK